MSFAGTKRTCVSCEARFLFEVSDEEARALATQASEKKKQAAIPRVERLGCAPCLLSYNRRVSSTDEEVRCTVCGQLSTMEQARANAKRFDAVERDMWEGVQRGDPAAALQSLLAMGQHIDKARQRVDTAVISLPFVRSQWRFSPPVEHPPLAPPPCCDTCGTGASLRACRVMWRRDITLQRMANVTLVNGAGFVGGLLLGGVGSDLGNLASQFLDDGEHGTAGADHMEGLYYLCDACAKSGPKAFSTFNRFPAGTGLVVREVAIDENITGFTD